MNKEHSPEWTAEEIVNEHFAGTREDKECNIYPLIYNKHKKFLEADKAVLKSEIDEALKELKKGGFLYSDTDGVVPSVIFSRGYNQAIEDLRDKLPKMLKSKESE